jgi:hypothetical protein
MLAREGEERRRQRETEAVSARRDRRHRTRTLNGSAFRGRVNAVSGNPRMPFPQAIESRFRRRD